MKKIKQFLFANTNTKQTVVKNAFWLFASEAISRILKLVLVIYTARILGASGWGIFNYAMSIGSILMIFSDIGLGNLVTRELSKRDETCKRYISAASLLKIILSIISALLIISIGPYISTIKEANNIFWIISIILFFDSMRDLGLSINRASEKMEKEMTVKLVMNIIVIILGLYLLKIKPEPSSIAIAYAVGSFIGFIIISIIINNNFKDIISKINKNDIFFVFKIILPFAFINLISSLLSNTDIFMLGIWRDSTEIGLYSSVQRIEQFILIIPIMIGTAMLPIMSKFANKFNEKFKIVLEQSISATLLIGIPIILGGFILADQIIPLVFGNGFLEAIPILKILIFVIAFSFPFTILSNAIFTYNRQKELIISYLAGIIFNIIFNIIFIPRIGAIGASFSILLSTIIITTITWIKMKKINNFTIFSRLKKIILSSIIMFLFVIIFKYLNMNVIINILISSIIYFYTLYLLKEPVLKEFKDISKI